VHAARRRRARCFFSILSNPKPPPLGQARVGDGLVAVADLARARPGRLDLLMVDAGADDASLAMSCPPAPFLQVPTLPNILP
jgi:hypothetical protein